MGKESRPQVTEAEARGQAEVFAKNLAFRVKQKGCHALLSTHEILGVVQEEMYELQKAIHENDMEQVAKELHDIAVGCVWGAACIKAGKVDW